MRHSATATILGLLLALTAVALSACGSGGTESEEGSPYVVDLQGSYGFVLVEWIAADDYVRSTAGTCVPDGAGGLQVEVFRSVMAGHEDPVTLSPLTYLAGDGPGRFVLTDGQGRRFYADATPDGSVLAATTRDAGTEPALLLLVRRAGDVALPDLAGTWLELAWGRETISDGGSTELGDYAFAYLHSLEPDGATWLDAGHRISDIEGYFALGAQSTASTIAEVRPAGVVAWTRYFDGMTTHLGSFAADGNLMVLGGEYASTETSGTVVVRLGQASSPAELSGTYRTSSLGSSPFGHHARWGETTFADSGSGSSTFHYNLEGNPYGPGSTSLTYDVDADGVLTVHDGDDGAPLYGIVGAGGAYAVLAGGFGPDARAEFHILIR